MGVIRDVLEEELQRLERFRANYLRLIPTIEDEGKKLKYCKYLQNVENEILYIKKCLEIKMD